MSKTVYIGNAVSDENKSARGGEPGDQTKKEVRVQAWYLSEKGWVILRPKNSEIAEKLAYDMDAACQNDNIGYDQGDRNTLRSTASKVDYDCAKVSTPCECDCSSLVGVCCAYAGITKNHFNTANEVDVLMKTGAFDKLTDPKYTKEPSYLKRGDILVTEVKGHTAIVLTDGDKVENDPPSLDPISPAPIIKICVKGTVRVREKNSAISKKIKTVGTKGKYTFLPYYGQAIEYPYWYMTKVDNKDGYVTSNPKYTVLKEVIE